MMETRLPVYQEIQELVAFLPRLYAAGFEPVTKWNGGDKGTDGSYQLPWPDYNPVVEEFYRQVASECWLDYSYRPEEAARMLQDQEFIKSATLPQIKTILTFCLRGERFSDGHWADMIQQGHIRRILERLSQIGDEMKP
jgi:hypothetical protein